MFKQNGKWGLVDKREEFIVPAKYQAEAQSALADKLYEELYKVFNFYEYLIYKIY